MVFGSKITIENISAKTLYAWTFWTLTLDINAFGQKICICANSQINANGMTATAQPSADKHSAWSTRSKRPTLDRYRLIQHPTRTGASAFLLPEINWDWSFTCTGRFCVLKFYQFHCTKHYDPEGRYSIGWINYHVSGRFIRRSGRI